MRGGREGKLGKGLLQRKSPGIARGLAEHQTAPRQVRCEAITVALSFGGWL